nr:formyltransferase [Dissulfurirhabdus thermomarina]
MGRTAYRVLRGLGVSVPAVFTHRDDPGETRWFGSLAELADGDGVPVFAPEDVNRPEWVAQIRDLAPDVILSCYYRRMIGEEILRLPRIAALNLHGSLLPRYRGRCPVNWQILHGEREGGVTLHHMVRQADAGDIVGQRAVPIAETDTALDLFRKCEQAAAELLREMIPRVLDGTAPRVPQDSSRATYFGGRRPEDGRIDWSWPARRIYNLVRAVAWPYPGAFGFLRGRRLIVWWAEPAPAAPGPAPPGTVLEGGAAPVVAAGEGALRLVTVSEAGAGPDTPLDLAALVRPGDRFE